MKSDDDDDKEDVKDDTEDADSDIGEDVDGRHARMLQGITGMPSEAFEGTMITSKVF